MNAYELSATLLHAKSTVMMGRDEIKNGGYGLGKKLLFKSLEIYKEILKEADTNDPKGDYYGRFAYIAAYRNLRKVISELKVITKSADDKKHLEDVISVGDRNSVSNEDMRWFELQRIIG